jgi:hypothetical protein
MTCTKLGVKISIDSVPVIQNFGKNLVVNFKIFGNVLHPFYDTSDSK